MGIKRILLAEDELLVAKVFKMLLEKNKFDVMLVTEEFQAIESASEFDPDIIVLDVCLKNKSSGINAAKVIRKNGIKCPIIFTTGNSFEQTKGEMEKIENTHLFIKPVDVDQLLNYIKNNFESV
jgi:DNA-binding response OmpR family regulator